MARIDLEVVANLAATYQVQTVTLSASSIVLILAALSEFEPHYVWFSSDHELTQADYDDIDRMVALALDEMQVAW